jgi:predicted glycoside hydrolase/deacetylase ChbG (UPF0249 family)
MAQGITLRGFAMKKLLIRADDLGYSEGINYGIAKSVLEGVIGSVGVMPNMDAVEHGVDLLKKSRACFGQHTNICVGKPLTDPALIPSIRDENGEFKSSRVYRSAKEDFVVLEEVIMEIEAQYTRFIELFGEKPHYFEGHTIPSANFFKGLGIVAEKYGLKYQPFPMVNPFRVGATDVYAKIESMDPNYDPYEALKRILENAHEGACDLFVCHPGYLDAYILEHSSLTTLRPYDVRMACDPATRRLIEDSGIQIVTYDDL